MDSTYSHVFLAKQVQSQWLAKPENLMTMRTKGYEWVSVVKRSWESSLRTPIMGRLLSISTHYHPGAERVTSRRGKAMIYQIC